MGKELELSDFDGLNVKDYEAKLQEVYDHEFLDALADRERDSKGPRKTIFAEIEERRRELEPRELEPVEGEIKEEVESEDDASGYLDTPLGNDTDGVLISSEVLESKIIEGLADRVIPLRLEVDKLYQFTDHHMSINPEVARKLFMAKCWLGKVLAISGKESPYTRAEEVSDIPPTAEKNEGTAFFVKMRDYGLKNALNAINETRDDIASISEVVFNLPYSLPNPSSMSYRQLEIATQNSYKELSEARFLLGEQLSELKR